MSPSPTASRDPNQNLRQQAANAVNLEYNAQINPLNADITSLLGRESDAQRQTTDMFGNIMPYVQASAANLQSAHDQAFQSEQGIFNQYGSDLNKLGQDAASRAQALAQAMGGPVATGEFQAAVNPAQGAFANYKAGSLLNSLALGSADNNAAQAFAGKVFPLVATEQQANIRKYYEGEVKRIQDQIDTLNASKSNAINSRFNDMLIQKHQYDLQQAQLGLDRTKAARDWAATKQTLALEQRKEMLAEHAQGFTERATGAKLKLDAKALGLRDKTLSYQIGKTAAELGIKRTQVENVYRAAIARTQVMGRKLDLSEQHDAATFVDSATTGGKAVAHTVVVPVDKKASFNTPNTFLRYDKKGNVLKDASGAPQLWITRQVTAPAMTPIHDPTRLYQYVQSQMPRTSQSVILNMIRTKFGLPKAWMPGDPVGKKAK